VQAVGFEPTKHFRAADLQSPPEDGCVLWRTLPLTTRPHLCNLRKEPTSPNPILIAESNLPLGEHVANT